MKRSRRLVRSDRRRGHRLDGRRNRRRAGAGPGSPAGGSALRPAVMGPSAGVSTGHPLTTAAAFGILLKGGNAFDAGVASLIAGGVLEQDLYSLGGEALVLVYPKKEGKVTSVVGQGWAPKAVDVDWYLSRKQDARRRGARSRRRPRRAARGADRAREVGHDELRGGRRAGHRLRGERLPDAPEHGAGDSRASSSSSRRGRTTRSTG